MKGKGVGLSMKAIKSSTHGMLYDELMKNGDPITIIGGMIEGHFYILLLATTLHQIRQCHFPM